MADNIDLELIDLINKLTKIQKSVGGGKVKEENKAVGADGNVDRFLDLRNQMIVRISGLKESLEAAHRIEKSGGSNPKELISLQSKIRTELASLSEDWKELDTLFRHEAKKRRSKLSSEELQQREQMLTMMQIEIQAMRDIQRSGYVKGYKSVQMVTMAESELFKPISGDNNSNAIGNTLPPGTRGVYGSRNDEMTNDHRVALQRLKERDLQIDDQIVEIGKGVDELHEIAKTAHDEIKIQNNMLDTLQEKVDDVHEHVVNINVRLKEVLEETRRSDKLCVDIFCVLLFIGMVIVLVQLSKKGK